MNEELLKKLIEEHALTAEETLELDQALEASGQAKAAEWVHGLRAQEPSLSWRSALNERLARPKRRRATWIWCSAAATVAAMSLWVAVMLHQPSSEPSSGGDGPSVEEVLVDTHRQSLSPVSTEPLRASKAQASAEWVDIEAL